PRHRRRRLLSRRLFYRGFFNRRHLCRRLLCGWFLSRRLFRRWFLGRRRCDRDRLDRDGLEQRARVRAALPAGELDVELPILDDRVELTLDGDVATTSLRRDIEVVEYRLALGSHIEQALAGMDHR